MEQPSHETNDKFSCFTKITDFSVDNIMQAVTHQPVAFGFGSTEIGLTRVWECLAPLNELLIRRDITQTVNGVLNQFTICDHNERELFAGKDDLSIRVQGHFINIFDNSRSLAMQVKLTTRLWDASYQVLSADGRLMTDITFIFDLCVPMYRMYDDYGSTLATFHLLCFSGGFGERHWQIRDPEGNEIGSLVFLYEWCDTLRNCRLKFFTEMNTEKKAILLGTSLIVILQYQTDKGE